MPCHDVTECITVVVDGEDRLKSYSFTKRTCGQGIGQEDLLHDTLAGRPVDELLGYTAESYVTAHPNVPDKPKN